MKLKVGHATRSADAAAAAAAGGGTEGKKGEREAISDIFDFHHPRSRGGEKRGRFDISSFVVGGPFVLRLNPSLSLLRCEERHECQCDDVKAAPFWASSSAAAEPCLSPASIRSLPGHDDDGMDAPSATIA